jgi:class 3 adenylate cyclase/tetratricopeptide (TPR) repeat protein
MKCPACQSENPEGMKFCIECGKRLEIICSKCGFANLPISKFCGDCGTPLTASTAATAPSSKPAPKNLTFDEKLQKIQRYLPSGLAEKILSQRDRIEGERKQVTVMFTDMSGYTAMTEKLDPEEAYALMDQVYECLIQKVTEYGGTVNELTGDGIMALFGAPIALEDAPQRAIRASLAIHREMVQFNEKLRREKAGLPPLKMRAGIHTGPVVVGTLGNDLRVDFKAVGDTVNLASRMEGMAEPGSTYCTEDTFKLTEGLFRFEGLGEREVKGKEKPIRIYRVIAPSTSRTRFDVSAERGLTPFVGRERERELLLDAYERARQGRGQAVSIVSEAGMGKSRLLYEFRKAILNEDITFLEGKCLSFSRSVAYQPISDILKSNFDIREDDWDPAIRKKVSQGLQAISVDEAPAMPYLLELLSAKDSGIEKIQISPEGKKDKTIETIKKLILKGSEMRPLVMAIEDLHWIDKTSEDLLKYLLESIPGARVLLILTYRPEFIPAWGSRSYHNQLLLNRLSNRESLLMVNHLLSTSDVETALEEVILEKTEGIPFFIEEFIKSLKDLGFIERKDAVYRIAKELQSARIPSTIQDIIMARVDALPEGAKELLQIGSLIEREFSYRLIKDIMNIPEDELFRHLSILKDAELLYERGIFPDSTLIFKHALTREVVSGTLLERKKKDIHGAIGRAMEEVYKDTLEERLSSLAEHFKEAGDYEKAARYFHRSATKTRRANAYLEAIAFATEEVACIEKLSATVDVQMRIIDARVNLATFLTMLNYATAAKDAVAPIIDLAHELNYRKRLPAIYITMAIYFYLVEERHNDAEARRYMTEAMRLAPEENDFVSLLLAYNFEGQRHAWNCEYAEGESSLARLIEISRTAGDVTGLILGKSAMITIYVETGRVDEAMKCGEEILRLAVEADDLYLKGGAYCVYGAGLLFKGLLPEAEESLRLCLTIYKKNGPIIILMNNFWLLGELLSATGRYLEAEECFNGFIALHERTRQLPSFTRFIQIRKIAAGVLGRLNPAIDSVLNFDINEIRRLNLQGWAAYGMGEIFLNIDDAHMDEAEAWIKKAIEIAGRHKIPWYLARDYTLYAAFFKKKGDPAQAKEKLGKAIEIMRSINADGWVKKYEEELAGL